MVKAKTKMKQIKRESDSAYLLKIVLFVLVGSLWVKISYADGDGQFPIPIGFIIGILFAMHDHFKIDRKIEYALLLVSMFVGFWLPIGIYVSL